MQRRLLTAQTILSSAANAYGSCLDVQITQDPDGREFDRLRNDIIFMSRSLIYKPRHDREVSPIIHRSQAKKYWRKVRKPLKRNPVLKVIPSSDQGPEWIKADRGKTSLLENCKNIPPMFEIKKIDSTDAKVMKAHL